MSPDAYRRTPPLAVFALAATVAAPAGYFLPSIWYSSTLLGAGLAVATSCIFLFEPQNSVEAVLMALIFWGLFSQLPNELFVLRLLLPMLVGTTIGLVIGCLWKELH